MTNTVIPLPRTWVGGQCRNGHDITIAANVGTRFDRAGVQRYECRACTRARKHAYRQLDYKPVSAQHVYLPRVCERCGETYEHGASDEGYKKWLKRRYCSRSCARPNSKVAGRVNAAKVISALLEDTAGSNWRAEAACGDYCAGPGFDPRDDAFFPASNSASSLVAIVKAKQICAACPVREACLRYAVATGIEDGIFGGLTFDERRQVTRMAAAS